MFYLDQPELLTQYVDTLREVKEPLNYYFNNTPIFSALGDSPQRDFHYVVEIYYTAKKALGLPSPSPRWPSFGRIHCKRCFCL